MTFFSILGNIFIGPLTLIFETVFYQANKFIGHPGLAIVALSLVMNFLVLPLYRRADAMQEQARDVENKLKPGVDHIKKTFSGDERMMILQTYYRQNDYSPLDALKGSMSLLLEIPFFIAAYQFLSHVACLQGVSFGPIADLGAPDGMLKLGGFAVNVLPILMTLINVVSSAVYAKGFPLKTKIQLYGVAAIFLVFLYNSPSGLVFYWTLNNVFSLVKNLFYKIRNPRFVLSLMAFAAGMLALAYGLFFVDAFSHTRRVLGIGLGIVLMLPLAFSLFGSRIKPPKHNIVAEPDRRLFVLGCLFLTVLTGLLIPSTFIAASPQEYVNINHFHHPLNYLVMSLSAAAGLFLVWLQVFYWLSGPGAKWVFDKLLWMLSILALVNYMFFGTELGLVSSQLRFEAGEMIFRPHEGIINLAVMALGALILAGLALKWRKLPRSVLSIGCAALLCMSALNAFTVKKEVQPLADRQEQAAELASIPLSRDGKNVIVFMLDRALGQTVPYFLNEKPELKEQFDGFTYYSNVISHGGHTNLGSPGLLGGYEYTPVGMNMRPDKSLKEKQNEALLMLPRIFSDEGYRITVCDPVYANYQWVPDLSIFDEYPEMNTYITLGRFDALNEAGKVQENYRNFFRFALMKCVPVVLQDVVYADGSYNHSPEKGEGIYDQIRYDMSRAEGLSTGFTDGYNVLDQLPAMSEIISGGENTYLFIDNEAPHYTTLLQAPDYVPAEVVDNSRYDSEMQWRFQHEGRQLNIVDDTAMGLYHINMSCLIQLGEWFDFMRQQGVYDNTRIVIVADHGLDTGMSDELILGEDDMDMSLFYPLLMFKDFDSHGFETSDEFMTNADVPTLATHGLVENPVNPFTGKPLNSDEKTAHEQFISLSEDWVLTQDNGNTFNASRWASVRDNIWDEANWRFYEQELVLDRYEINE